MVILGREFFKVLLIMLMYDDMFEFIEYVYSIYIILVNSGIKDFEI